MPDDRRDLYGFRHDTERPPRASVSLNWPINVPRCSPPGKLIAINVIEMGDFSTISATSYLVLPLARE